MQKKQSNFGVVFRLFPKNGTLKFQWFLGCSKNRLFVDLGTEKHQKRRSNWYLLEALSGDSDFLKNVLPLKRELDSRGCTLPRIDQEMCFFERFEPRLFRNHIFAAFFVILGSQREPKNLPNLIFRDSGGHPKFRSVFGWKRWSWALGTGGAPL